MMDALQLAKLKPYAIKLAHVVDGFNLLSMDHAQRFVGTA